MATESSAALAKLAESTKAACATSADVVKSAAAHTGTRAAATGAKAAAIATHSLFLAAFAGIIVGTAACYFFTKRRGNEQ